MQCSTHRFSGVSGEVGFLVCAVQPAGSDASTWGKIAFTAPQCAAAAGQIVGASDFCKFIGRTAGWLPLTRLFSTDLADSSTILVILSK